MNEQKKQRLIEKYRYCNVDDHWWVEPFEETIVEKMADAGFVVRKIRNGRHYDVGVGMDSYGRGECVVHGASVSTTSGFDMHEDFRKFFGALRSRYPQNFTADLPPAGLAYMADVLDSVKVETAGRYDTMYVTTTGWEVHDTLAEDIAEYMEWEVKPCDFRAIALAAALEAGGWTANTVEEAAELLVKDICAEVAALVEKEYDYQTSDEAVWETIEANEWHLDEEDDDEELDC